MHTLVHLSARLVFHIPENSLGTLGTIIPLIAALGLVIASKKNMITITVEK